MMGPARLLIDGEDTKDVSWRRQRVRQLVAALVAFREIRRDRLGVLLWPDFDDRSLSANLRQTLSYLQALLEPHRDRGDAPWFLQQNAGVLQLRRDDHLSIDVWELEDALDGADAAAATGAPATELRHLQAALNTWRGDPFDDVAGEDWADPLRERLRQRFVRGAVRAGDLLTADGQARAASAAARAALVVDPAHEPAIRLHVSAELAAGDHAAAHDAFEAGRRALADLGISPEPATIELGRRAAGASR
jgi:DNA-binding SARP family transcriptional activator